MVHPIENRRVFLKWSGGLFLGAALGPSRATAGTGPGPSALRLGLLTDTFFASEEQAARPELDRPGYLYHEALTLATDLVRRFGEDPERPVSLALHAGNLLRSGNPDQARAALEWLSTQSIPFRLTVGASDTHPAGLNSKEFAAAFSEFGFPEGRTDYSYDWAGFHFAHLDSSPAAAKAQQEWLRDDLARARDAPAVLVMHASPPEEELRRLVLEFPHLRLLLHGRASRHEASLLEGALMLGLCSPVAYPCAARALELSVDEKNRLTIRSEFLQTRRLDLVEQSFHQSHSRRPIRRLGERKDRSFIFLADDLALEPVVFASNPALAPWWRDKESLTLAVLADTHLCLDRFIEPGHDGDYELIGHFTETGSQAILDDILEQVVQGRHRVEFFDETFGAEPEAERHYLNLPVDALLIAGDLAEHGRREEAEVARERLSRLPVALRDKTLVAAGNHDLKDPAFSPDGPASRRKPFAEFWAEHGPGGGETDYLVELADWLCLVVLDSVIPTRSNFSLLQERIDWLEDQLRSRPGQAVIIASHHPLYQISLVPPLMQAYLRARSHFDPQVTAARVQLHRLFAECPNVKLVISGHYHGVCLDQFRKAEPAGPLPDDPFTTHVQVPCTVEYPCGYRLFQITRDQTAVTIDYRSAYTRRADLRAQSSQAMVYKLLGTGLRVPPHYQGTLSRLAQKDNLLGDLAKMDPYDLVDLNVRGFKDGTARAARGNSGKDNINGGLECTIQA